MLEVSHSDEVLHHVQEGIQNLQGVPKVRSGLLFEPEVHLRGFDRLSEVEVERDDARSRVQSL